MMTIRDATPGDAAPVTRLAQRVYAEMYQQVLPAPAIEQHLRTELSGGAICSELIKRDDRTLVACRGDVVVAICKLAQAPTIACVPYRPAIEISRFFVEREHRGTGLAYELLIYARHAAWEMGAAAIWLRVPEKNHRALAFFRKHAFRDVGLKAADATPVHHFQIVLASELRV
jgi:GNAT superfamily N-acetyltransferase